MQAKRRRFLHAALIPTIMPFDPLRTTSVLSLHTAAAELTQRLTQELMQGSGYRGRRREMLSEARAVAGELEAILATLAAPT
jgi:hypothetical protein